MKLNIVTAASNYVWKAILEKITNPEDITIGLSRKGCEMANVLNVQVSDLADHESTSQVLNRVLATIDMSKVEIVKIFHNCCYAVAEIPDLDKNHPLLKENPELLQKLILQDLDWDWIDDRSYHSLLTTFRNVFGIISEKCCDKKISIWTICSLIDHKSYIPTVFQSMVKTNKILREEINSLSNWNKNIQSVCISASTVRTETEQNFRKNCPDKDYWVSGQTVADSLVLAMNQHKNSYRDIPVYVFNPNYDEIYKNETDEHVTQRIMWDIWLL